MRTNIDLDDTLLAETMRLSGKKTKRAAVKEAMRVYTREKERAAIMRDIIESTRGIGWDDGLTENQDRKEFAEDPAAFGAKE